MTKRRNRAFRAAKPGLHTSPPTAGSVCEPLSLHTPHEGSRALVRQLALCRQDRSQRHVFLLRGIHRNQQGWRTGKVGRGRFAHFSTALSSPLCLPAPSPHADSLFHLTTSRGAHMSCLPHLPPSSSSLTLYTLCFCDFRLQSDRHLVLTPSCGPLPSQEHQGWPA